MPYSNRLINWWTHYSEKNSIHFDDNSFEKISTNDAPFMDILEHYVPKNSRILETGSGLSRTAMTMASQQYKVTALDIEQRFIKLGKQNQVLLIRLQRFHIKLIVEVKNTLKTEKLLGLEKEQEGFSKLYYHV